MNKYVVISLVCLALAFGGTLSQGGHTNKITVASVVPLVAWGVFLLVKAFVGWLADRRAARTLRR